MLVTASGLHIQLNILSSPLYYRNNSTKDVLGLSIAVLSYDWMVSHWAIFQRKPQTNHGHGPERFSLLFISGEGVATYQAIYFSNKCRPMGIVLRGYSGFAGNWTKFEKRKSLMAEWAVQCTLSKHP